MSDKEKRVVLQELLKQYNTIPALAVSLIFERQLGNASRFHPYIETLPSLTESPSNMFSFTDDQLSLVRASLGLAWRWRFITDCPAQVAGVLHTLASNTASWSDWIVGSSKAGGWAAEVDTDAPKWACSLAASRWQNTAMGPAFGPVTDMTNHKWEPNGLPVGTSNVQTDTGLEIRATKEWQAGEQMYDMCESSNDKPAAACRVLSLNMCLLCRATCRLLAQ